MADWDETDCWLHHTPTQSRSSHLVIRKCGLEECSCRNLSKHQLSWSLGHNSWRLRTLVKHSPSLLPTSLLHTILWLGLTNILWLTDIARLTMYVQFTTSLMSLDIRYWEAFWTKNNSCIDNRFYIIPKITEVFYFLTLCCITFLEHRYNYV